MITANELNEFLENAQLNEMVATVWDLLGKNFEQAQTLLHLNRPWIARRFRFMGR